MANRLLSRASRHERNLLEAQIRPDEAVAWAQARYKKTGNWPSKRFRVEGSRAGSSKLLTRVEAEVTSKQYGGTVVELIPAKGESLGTMAEAAAQGLPECPQCGAQANRSCRRGTERGAPRTPHAARLRMVEGRRNAHEEVAIGLPECPLCGAAAGRPCTKGHFGGRITTRMPHVARLPAPGGGA